MWPSDGPPDGPAAPRAPSAGGPEQLHPARKSETWSTVTGPRLSCYWHREHQEVGLLTCGSLATSLLVQFRVQETGSSKAFKLDTLLVCLTEEVNFGGDVTAGWVVLTVSPM